MSYLTNALPRMDADLLVKLRETMERVDDGPERNALLTCIHAICDESLTSTKPKAINGHLVVPPHVWQQRVRDTVQAIISPDILAWMDDDYASSESQICQRSLYEIKFRFYKYVISNSLQRPSLMYSQTAPQLLSPVQNCTRRETGGLAMSSCTLR